MYKLLNEHYAQFEFDRLFIYCGHRHKYVISVRENRMSALGVDNVWSENRCCCGYAVLYEDLTILDTLFVLGGKNAVVKYFKEGMHEINK